MSANGARPDGIAYQRTKFEAERYLAGSGIAGTVFRPSLIFGDPRGRMEFATRFRDETINTPFPAPGFFSGWSPSRGSFWVTPVHVEDVAEAYLRALEGDDAVERTFTLGGARTLSWPDLIRTIAAACRLCKLIVPVPAWSVRTAAAVLDRFDFFPMTRDQFTMLMEGDTVESIADFERLSTRPRAFEADELAYLRRN
jgi:NADH dehydrogenase